MRFSRGHSLVELMICMSVGTIILMIGTGIVHRTMRLESATRQQADMQCTANRLARDFRRDAHRAAAVAVVEEAGRPAAVQFDQPDERPITYTLRNGMVLREQVLADRQTRREPYYLAPGYVAEFDEVYRPNRAVLTLRHDSEYVGEAPRTLAHVEAEVGRLLRLATMEEPTP